MQGIQHHFSVIKGKSMAAFVYARFFRINGQHSILSGQSISFGCFGQDTVQPRGSLPGLL